MADHDRHGIKVGGNVWATIKKYLISGGVGIIIGASIVFGIAQRNYTELSRRMQDKLDTYSTTNKQLTEDNSRLTELNRRSTATITELETRKRTDATTIATLQRSITERDKQYQATIGTIKNSLAAAVTGLGETNQTVQGIINTISSIESIIHSLP